MKSMTPEEFTAWKLARGIKTHPPERKHCKRCGLTPGETVFSTFEAKVCIECIRERRRKQCDKWYTENRRKNVR